jgi:hypothetical protein
VELGEAIERATETLASQPGEPNERREPNEPREPTDPLAK